ncbi:unnamed protein product [Pylaiella littoralis]
MRLGVALLALSQASSVLSFVQHLVAPQAFGSTNSRRNGNSASMVASIQTSSTVSSTKQGTNGAGQVQGSKGTAGVGTEAPAVEFDQQPGGLRTIEMYDTTLRDGTQMEGISASVNDKLKIALQLYNFGMHYIEGGWPGSNPKDVEFFERARKELPSEAWAKVVAFGSTRRKFKTCAEDKQLESLISAGTGCVTIVAKAWDLHVDHILEVPREENLAMVHESVAHLKAAGKEVMLDLEHFFDGWKANPEYTMQVCEAAVEANVDVLVLCDTNGGSLPWEVDEIVRDVKGTHPSVRLAIHCHNDQGLAVANSLQAVRSGVDVVQGTVNGIGERTGNANLMTIIPTLQLKMGLASVGENLRNLTALSRFTDEQFNMAPASGAPYTGMSAFAHKGGIHVSAVNKIPDSYQHIDPDQVGNHKRILVSELSGQSNILAKVEDSGMASKSELEGSQVWRERVGQVLKTVKQQETQGYSYEGADASVNLIVRRTMKGYVPPFKLLDYLVQIWDSDHTPGGLEFPKGPTTARATVKVRVPSMGSEVSPGLEDEEDPGVILEVAEGNGPVNALAKGLFRALLPTFPSLETVTLSDYKVRILDQESATRAKTRVFIEFFDKTMDVGWSTVGVNTNIISASMSALMDGLEYALVEYGQSCSIDAGPKSPKRTE